VTAHDSSPDHGEIAAAGGVLWRMREGRREFAIIHRPKYDDWTLAKGKLDPGETYDQAAMREVGEETGFAAELGDEIGEVRYEHRGRTKRVRYWEMRALSGRFEVNNEVDGLRWLPVDQALALLTYERDQEILGRFVNVDARRD
jgi:8-oxo-dGTP diphosphatase